MMILGLTGGIGSGKSVVAKMFRELGADVVGADGPGSGDCHTRCACSGLSC